MEKSKSLTGKINIYKAIFSMFKADFARNVALAVTSEILNIVNLFCLRYFFAWIADPNHIKWHGYAYALFMGCISILTGLMKNHGYDIAYELGNYVRVSILGTIFKKLERLTQKS